MEDGIDEFMITLLGSYQIIQNLQLTLYGEYTFDSAERKSQLGTNRKAEAGLRANVQF
jgi:phage gp45-like